MSFNKNKMIRMVLIIYLILISSYLFGQDLFKGLVIDSSSDEPLTGVSIIILDSGKETITDLDGNFSIECNKSSDILLVNLTGYYSKTIDLTNITHNSIRINLIQDRHIQTNFDKGTNQSIRVGLLSSFPDFFIGGLYSHNLQFVGKKKISDFGWTIAYQHSSENDKKLDYSITSMNLFSVGSLSTSIGFNGIYYSIDSLSHLRYRIFLSNEFWRRYFTVNFGVDRVDDFFKESSLYGYYIGVEKYFDGSYPANKFGDILFALGTLTLGIFENCYFYGDFINYDKEWFFKVGYEKYIYWVEKGKSFILEPVTIRLSYEELYNYKGFTVGVIFKFVDNRLIVIG